MGKTIRFLITNLDGETTIVQESHLREVGINNDADVERCFGEAASWLTVTFREPEYRLQQRVQRECAGDDTLAPQKRFLAGVEGWSRGEVSEEAFLSLKPPELAAAIDSAILLYWFPSMGGNPGFFQRLRKPLESSDAAAKSA